MLRDIRRHYDLLCWQRACAEEVGRMMKAVSARGPWQITPEHWDAARRALIERGVRPPPDAT